ncbi:hypothetical protein ACFSR6_08270 [Pedobacter vanadiisoli]|uniref:Uncharacterized protein n=1 Tax=Pedobacter vanadiisoli TaxID=1761975 RepID=A0ABW5MH60_9SPHI
MDLFKILNTRELASSIWVTISIVFFLIVPSKQKELVTIIKGIFSRKFTTVYILAALYCAMSCTILYFIKAWDTSLVKDSLFWMFFAALPMMYKSARSKNIREYFGSTLKSLLTVTVVLEFLMGLHTFSIWLELLLVPISFLLFVLTIFSKQKPEYSQVQWLFEWTTTIIGVLIVMFEFRYVTTHINDFLKLAYLKQFTLPILLSLLFIPFLYLLVIYIRFEETFAILTVRFQNNPNQLYTKILIIRFFLNDLEGLKRWRQYIFRTHPQTKKAIKDSIKEIKELQQIEKNPPIIPLAEGWSPYWVKNILKEVGIHTEYYMHYFEDEWGVTSNNLHLTEDFLANDIIYNISGNRKAVTQLKLRLMVFDLSKKANSHEQFLFYIALLWKKIFDTDLPRSILQAVMVGKKFRHLEKGCKIEVDLEEYNTALNGYELKFKIIHAAHPVFE